MASDLIFYTNPQSRGRIARWMLEEVGAPYETQVMDYASTMKGDAYRAINPMGKVPAIVHRGHVVPECAAICAYLADAFPDSGLPPPPADLAAYYRWLSPEQRRGGQGWGSTCRSGWWPYHEKKNKKK